MIQAQYQDSDRGTGRTTRQLNALKKNGVYLWCNSQVDYPRRLAAKMCRSDITVLPRSALGCADKYHGVQWSEFDVDHAFWETPASSKELGGLITMRSLVRV